jgi:dTDP-4-amino-4,6-dideoxygalactose transaminase
MADMDAILEIAEEYQLIVVEDACQAHGAEYFSKKDGCWKKAGSMGRAAAFSFYPGKNLGACGEAGAVTTHDGDLAQKIRMLRDHGQAQKYYHEIEGYNGRLDAIQAGILQVKLHHLAAWNAERRESAYRYGELLSATPDVVVPYEPSWSRAVYHLYVVRVQSRAKLQQHLSAANIGTGIHYPVPLHLQRAYDGLGYMRGDFPIAERATSEILSLPMYPGLALDQQRRYCCCRQLARPLIIAAAAIVGHEGSMGTTVDAITQRSPQDEATGKKKIWVDLDNSPLYPQAERGPDVVDIDERTDNMNPDRLREYLEVHSTGSGISRHGMKSVGNVPVDIRSFLARDKRK